MTNPPSGLYRIDKTDFIIIRQFRGAVNRVSQAAPRFSESEKNAASSAHGMDKRG